MAPKEDALPPGWDDLDRYDCSLGIFYSIICVIVVSLNHVSDLYFSPANMTVISCRQADGAAFHDGLRWNDGQPSDSFSHPEVSHRFSLVNR
jgi:hypothetical protein